MPYMASSTCLTPDQESSQARTIRPLAPSADRRALSAFGLVAVTAMLICYAREERSRWFVLGFAGAAPSDRCTDFFKAWPFGLVEAVWSAVAIRRWDAREGHVGFAEQYPAFKRP